MNQPNTRPTRSRRSSPFVPTQNNANSSPKSFADASVKKTFMDKWIEPTLPAPIPSFAEAGIERHGVVANMAPLGTRPSAKVVKSAAKPEAADGGSGRRSATGRQPDTPAPSASVTPKEAIMTPEPLPNIARRRSSSTKMEDLDYVPPSTPQQTSARKSLPRSSVAPQSARSESQGMFAAASNQHTPINQQSPSMNYPRAMNTYNDKENGWDYAQRKNNLIVEEAVDLAVHEHRYPTAYALRTLYDEDMHNFGKLIESMIYETASQDDKNEFYRLMSHRKKMGRKDKTAEYYFMGDGSDPPIYRSRPRPQPSVPQIIYQPFVPMIIKNESTYQTPYATPYATTVQPPPTSTTAVGATMTDDLTKQSMEQSSSTVASPRKVQDHAHYPNKKHKGNDFTTTDEEMNDDSDTTTAVADKTMEEQQNGVTLATSPVVAASPPLPELSERPRAGSVSSSSSLSSVDEQILEGDEYTNPMDFDHAPINAGTTKTFDGFEGSKGQGMIGANDNAKFGASVSTETHLNAGRSVKRNQPMINENLSGSDQYNFSINENNANSKLSARTKSKTSSPAPPSFSAINVPRNNIIITNSNTLRARENNQNQLDPMAPELPRTVSSSSSVAGSVPVLKHTTGRKSQIIFKSKNKALPRHPYEEGEAITQLKRKAREITNSISVKDSFERGYRAVTPNSGLDLSDEEDSLAIPTVAATSSGRPAKVRLINKNERATRSSASNNNSNNYDSEMSSPTVLSFQPDLAPGSLPNSRAGTPTTHNRPTRKAKTGTGLRVKTSPMKKKSGPSAGIPRASGEQDSPSEKDRDNDEYCASCGGNGILVCCDGCTRSFHFKCIDPPLSEEALDKEEQWFCTACNAHNAPRSKDETTGTFGPLFANLERMNPSAFNLPKSIREYFDNVKTGGEGEYEEGSIPKPKNRSGYDETPDYFKLKDSKGNTILCHNCHQAASAPDRAIIPCTYCSLSWHLDCLDIPLAKEPPPGKAWRCPAHIDDLLSLSGGLGPAHKFRKIKGSTAIKPAVSRGLKNNGYIEIENAPTEDEDEGSGFFDKKEYGRVYKLPEEGVKLDFISQVHRKYGSYSQRNIAKKSASPPQPIQSSEQRYTGFNTRSLDEQQAALNMAYLANSNPNINMTENLINTLILEAPEAVIKLLAAGDMSKVVGKKHEPLSDTNNSALTAMMLLVQEKLDNSSPSSSK